MALLRLSPRLHLRGGALSTAWCLQAFDVHAAEAIGRASSKATGAMAGDEAKQFLCKESEI